MRYYPVFLDLRGRRCVVVGGGQVAERKVRGLLKAGAQVAVVSPKMTAKLRELAERGKIEHRSGEYEAADLEGAFLVIGATGDDSINARVCRDAKRRRILCNVVDRQDLCDFISPSMVSRGRLQIAVATDGASPALSRKIRKKLQKEFGPEYGPFLELMAELRQRVRSEIGEASKRREIFHRLVNSRILSLLRRGEDERARKLADRIVSGRASSTDETKL